MKTTVEIREEIIEVNYYLMKALQENNEKEIIKNKILLDNLIKIYLKVNI
jgi:hypothetical protein